MVASSSPVALRHASPDLDQRVHVLDARDHAPIAGQVASQAHDFEAGEPGGPLDHLDRPVRPHALAQVADIHHHDHLVTLVQELGGFGQELDRPETGVQRHVGPAHHIHRLAGGRDAQEHQRQQGAGPAMAPRFWIRNRRACPHRPVRRPGAPPMGAGHLGDAGDLGPVVVTGLDHGPGIGGDPVGMKFKARSAGVHLECSVMEGFGPRRRQGISSGWDPRPASKGPDRPPNRPTARRSASLRPGRPGPGCPGRRTDSSGR